MALPVARPRDPQSRLAVARLPSRRHRTTSRAVAVVVSAVAVAVAAAVAVVVPLVPELLDRLVPPLPSVSSNYPGSFACTPVTLAPDRLTSSSGPLPTWVALRVRRSINSCPDAPLTLAPSVSPLVAPRTSLACES